MTLLTVISFPLALSFLPRGFKRSKTLGLLLTTWHLPTSNPTLNQDPLWATRLWETVLQFFQTSVSLYLLLRPWLYHVLNRKQSNSQPRVENGPTCRPGLILCHREWDWGQKANTDIGAQSEGRNICYPMDHCKASQLWLNTEQPGDLQKLPMPWPHPSESLIKSPLQSNWEPLMGQSWPRRFHKQLQNLRGRR